MNEINTMVVSEKAVAVVDNFFNGTAIQTGKRAYVKQLLNRNTVYNVSDYVRKLRKDRNIILLARNVRTTLKHMMTEGQIRYEIVNNKVYGYSL